MNRVGVCLGRFSPLHNGHVNNISQMCETFGIDNSLIVVGSSNEEISFRNFFVYSERRFLIKKLFPSVRVVGLPDYWRNGEDEWYIACEDLLESIFPNCSYSFYSGSIEDSRWFNKVSNSEVILAHDRYEDNISSSQIRDILLKQNFNKLDDLVSMAIKDDIIKFFMQRYLSTVIELGHDKRKEK